MILHFFGLPGEQRILFHVHINESRRPWFLFGRWTVIHVESLLAAPGCPDLSRSKSVYRLLPIPLLQLPNKRSAGWELSLRVSADRTVNRKVRWVAVPPNQPACWPNDSGVESVLSHNSTRTSVYRMNPDSRMCIENKIRCSPEMSFYPPLDSDHQTFPKFTSTFLRNFAATTRPTPINNRQQKTHWKVWWTVAAWPYSMHTIVVSGRCSQWRVMVVHIAAATKCDHTQGHQSSSFATGWSCVFGTGSARIVKPEQSEISEKNN